MPIYNEQASIGGVVREWKACLDTVAPDHRILILNDGSKDNTAQVLAGLAAATPGVEVINKPNSGHGRTCIVRLRRGHRARRALGLPDRLRRAMRPAVLRGGVGEARRRTPPSSASAWTATTGSRARSSRWFCRLATHVATGVPRARPQRAVSADARGRPRAGHRGLSRRTSGCRTSSSR